MRPWIPGDQITAGRLNEQAEQAAKIERMGMPAATSTLVGDALGQQSVLHRTMPQFLVIAAEDFLIQPSPTDLYAIYDNVPSGACFLLGLNKFSGQQDVSSANNAFRVYDPIGEVTGVSTITRGDVFWCYWDNDAQRYQANLTDAGFINVMLTMPLEAAEDYKTNPSYATALVLRKKDDGDLKVTGLGVTLVNRFKRISHDAYIEGIAAFLDREWRLVAADCNTGSSSSFSESVDDEYIYQPPVIRGFVQEIPDELLQVE